MVISLPKWAEDLRPITSEQVHVALGEGTGVDVYQCGFNVMVVAPRTHEFIVDALLKRAPYAQVQEPDAKATPGHRVVVFEEAHLHKVNGQDTSAIVPFVQEVVDDAKGLHDDREKAPLRKLGVTWGVADSAIRKLCDKAPHLTVNERTAMRHLQAELASEPQINRPEKANASFTIADTIDAVHLFVPSSGVNMQHKLILTTLLDQLNHKLGPVAHL